MFSCALPNRSTQSTSATRSSPSRRESGTVPGSSRTGIDLGAELGQLDAVADVSGRGTEDVAPVERRTGRLELVLEVRELDGTLGAAGHRDGRGEQPVVGADDDTGATGDLDRDRAAPRADAGVDDAQHDTGGHVADAPGERERAGADVERWDLVGEVDDADVRGDVTDDGLDDADELVGGAVVGQERHGVEAAHRADATEATTTGVPRASRSRRESAPEPSERTPRDPP